MRFLSGSTEHKAVWGLLAFLAMVDGGLLFFTGLRLALPPCLFVFAATLLLVGLAGWYSYRKNEPRLVALALLGAQLLIYTALAGVLSYLLVALGRPLIDDALVASDHALGLDWLAMHRWGKAHVGAHIALIILYYSLIPQLIGIEIFLITTRRFTRARELFWLFVLTSFGSIVISGMWPAQGAFAFFGIEANEPYVMQFLALRSGAMTVIDLSQVQGVVQFPSFHLAMAVILAYALRGVRFVFPLFLVLNLGVIIATPLVGGHHFADLWGGAILTSAVVFFLRRFLKFSN